mgnify:CR=1 FL=1
MQSSCTRAVARSKECIFILSRYSESKLTDRKLIQQTNRDRKSNILISSRRKKTEEQKREQAEKEGEQAKKERKQAKKEAGRQVKKNVRKPPERMVTIHVKKRRRKNHKWSRD